jgi:riboflavin kinase/FMN adenylyltransferase
MHIIRDFEHCPAANKGAVVALGNFDGVHLGHRTIIDICLAKAHKLSAPAAMMTFEPHPREFFARDHQPMRICRLSDKLQLLDDAGMHSVFLARFNAKLAATSAEDFVKTILHEQLGVRHVVTGYDFAFGKNRGGDVTFLEQETRKYGIGFTRVEPVNADGRVISSTAIRALLLQGNMQQAAQLLGRPYSISGRVRGGDKRGRELGYPTANLWLGTLFRPRFGIYAVRVTFKDGKKHAAVASLGINPMFGAKRPLLEVHCFDLNRMFYGERITVELVEFIREEKNFDSIEILKAQIAEDCSVAKTLLKGSHG